jgi:squalene-hopene/tetraprenyl-beta-curcumene cyclase
MQNRRFSRCLYFGLMLCVVCSVRAADTKEKFGPNTADEPMATKFSLKKSAEFLDHMGTTWTRERNCGSCHSNYNYMIARPSLSSGSRDDLKEVRDFFEERVQHWDDKEKGAIPRWDAEVVATAVTLAMNDAVTTKHLHPATKVALDRMWKIQKPNGSWEWLKCNWPPYEADDYYGAVFAALGVGIAPEGYQESPLAKAGLEKIRKYLKETPVPSLHHQTMKLWASLKVDGLMSKEEQANTIKELLALQQVDGGWALASLGNWKRHDGGSNDAKAGSDGFGTGFVIYVLRAAGVAADDAQIQKGVIWLKANQRASGRWFTRSVSNDKAHYITHAGTGFAVLALKACGVKED